MDEGQPIEVADFIDQMRKQSRGVLPATAANLPLNGSVATELTSLQTNHDIQHIHFTSHRKGVGWFVVSVKRVLRQLLTPILERQLAYNTANVRIASHLLQQVAAFQKITQEQADALQALRGEVGELIGAVHQEQTAAVQALRGEVAELIAAVRQEQTAAVQALRGEQTKGIGRVQQAQEASLQALRGEVQEQEAALQRELRERVTGMLQAHDLALQAMRERSSRAERRARRLLHLLTDGQTTDGERMAQSSPDQRTALHRHLEPDFDYFGLEERFRGTEEDIKGRQRIYLDYFRGPDQVLDIGCGRGEFLELLTEAGVQAKGVDIDLDMVLYCQEKGLDVVREDAFAYIGSLPDESLGGIFAAQVIEHLEPMRVVELVRLCHRKLRLGSALIFETPNPACLTVFARSFYMDLTHIRPIHPETMKFVLESTGFQDVELKFSGPVEALMRIPPLPGSDADGGTMQEFNRGVERLNDLLYGCQDYAVIGRKSSHP